MCMNSALIGMVTKCVLGGQMCSWLLRSDRQYVERTVAQKAIHAKAVGKVCNMLNKVSNAQ